MRKLVMLSILFGAVSVVHATPAQFQDTAEIFHGFLYTGGTFTTIDVPGAIRTNAFGINDAGQIVGFFQDTSGGTHGFLEIAGSFTTIDVPGAIVTAPSDINNAGQIVGYFADTSERNHGFLYS